jgi:hypothetical protein
MIQLGGKFSAVFSLRTGTHKTTRWYPKHYGLLLPSIQQLWYHKAPVDGRTTMSSESVCQVARSWVDMVSFHT